MISQSYSLGSLNIELGLVAKCLLSSDFKIILRNVLALGCTSKAYQSMINTDNFLRKMVELIDPKHPFFIFHRKEQKKESSFKHKFYELRHCYFIGVKQFPKASIHEVLKGEDDVKVLDWGGKNLSALFKNDLEYRSIEIFEGGNTPFTAFSDKFCAINYPLDSFIYVFTVDKVECLAKLKVEGVVNQLVIKDDLLCVLVESECKCNLIVFNLAAASPSESSTTIKLFKSELSNSSGFQIHFYKKHIIYEQHMHKGLILHALPLSYLQKSTIDEKTLPWITTAINSEHSRVLAGDNHLIEVRFSPGFNVVSIFKYDITLEGFRITEIAKDVLIFSKAVLFRDVCFHKDRLIFAYADHKATATDMIVYDMLSGMKNELCPISLYCDDPSPRLICTATKAYCLVLGNRGQFALTHLDYKEKHFFL